MISASICLSAAQTGKDLQYFAVCLQGAALSPRPSRENGSEGFRFYLVRNILLREEKAAWFFRSYFTWLCWPIGRLHSLQIYFICTLLSKSLVSISIFVFWKDASGVLEENIRCSSGHFASLSVGLLPFIQRKSHGCEIPVWDGLLNFPSGTKEDCMSHLLASFMKFSK